MTVENYQSKADRAKLDGLYECVLCACCSTSCPRTGGTRTSTRAGRPPAVVPLARRQPRRETTERLEFLDDASRSTAARRS